MRCRIAIVDDSRTLRARLLALLDELRDVEVVGTATDAPGAIALLSSAAPDVMIVDLHMPGGGMTVLEHARRAAHAPRMVVLTAYPTDQHRRRCLDLGADLFLDKTRDLDDLPERLRALAADQPRATA